MNGQPKHRHLIGAICLVAAGLFWVQAAQAARGYLAVVGASPLRFETVKTNYFVFDPKIFLPAQKMAETVSNAVNQLATAAGVATNSNAISPSNQSAATNSHSTATSPQIALGEEKEPARHFKFDFSSAAASDLLTVTPQMITQYLKPETNETNQMDQPGAVVFVPAEMQFTPPTTKVTAESRGIMGNESRATYQSQ